MAHFRSVILFLLTLASAAQCHALAGAASGSDSQDQSALRQAAGWLQQAAEPDTQYNYVMTCRVRLLLFWVKRDAVGGGYIRLGKRPSDQQTIELLFGSDPVKARGINRWGAGTELVRLTGPAGREDSSVFFGFMKSSKGESAGAMQDELSKEKNGGEHPFEGIISRVDRDRAVSTTVTFISKEDFDWRQYDQAQKTALEHLESGDTGDNRKIRHLDGEPELRCSRVGGFLSTVATLIDDAVGENPAPQSLCYLYNARHYKATLVSVRPVGQRTIRIVGRSGGAAIEQSYRDLREAHFEVIGQETASKSTFDVLLGTKGSLHGVPIQIDYQPNWWFQVVLNLAPPSSSPAGAASTTSRNLHR
jgi:hypothetical protein